MAININPGSPVRHVATFNTSANWTAPAGCTLAFVSIHGAAGGGRGGLGFSGDPNNNTGIGAAGVVSGAWVQVTPSAAHVITVGAGGAGGAANTNTSSNPVAGGTGGTTTFDLALSVTGGNGAAGTRNTNSVGTAGVASGITTLTSLSPGASTLTRVATLAATQNTGATAAGNTGNPGNARYGTNAGAGNAGAGGQIHIYI